MIQEASSINPTLKKDRIGLLDALRGFAIFGIFYGHLYEWSNYKYLDDTVLATMPTIWLDDIFDYMSLVLVDSKFRTVFAFLFGLSFALQMQRAEENSIPFVKRYVRRISVLFLFGLAHFFIYSSDILTAYSVTGLLLLAFRNRSDKCILIWAIGLTVWPIIYYGVMLKTGGDYDLSAKLYEYAFDRNEILLPMADINGYLYYFYEGFTGAVKYQSSVVIATIGDKIFNSQIPKVLGIFLFGMWVGRRDIITNPAAYLPLLKKVLCIGGIVGLTIGFVRANIIWEYADTYPLSETGWWVTLLFAFSVAPTALAYIAGFTLLWQNSVWQAKLNLLAPIGRMSLTNYLMHSLIGLTIYYAVAYGGLFQPSPSYFFLITTLVFLIQLGFSHWWLARFRYGPVEWVWRMLTYGRRLPLRLTSKDI